MKNELQVIDEREILGKRFRVYGDFENLLFLAKDVAEWIDYSKKSNGNACITIAEIKEILPENRIIITKPIGFSGKHPLKSSDLATRVEDNSEISTERILRVSKNDPLFLNYILLRSTYKE